MHQYKQIYERLLRHVHFYITTYNIYIYTLECKRGCRGRDCMVVGFSTTYAISAYHH